MKLKKISVTALSLLVSAIFFSQKSFSQTTFYHRYIIEFTDKDNNPYSTSNPSQYLSQRSIDRRNRYNIPVVKSDLPINPSYIQQVLATGVKLLNRSKWLNSISIQTDDSLALVAISNLPFVKSAHPVALRNANPNVIQRDKFEHDAPLPGGFPEKTSSPNSFDYGPAFHQIDMLNGEVLHDKGYRGQGMVMAILDGGFYNTHPDSLDIFDSLFLEHRIAGKWNFVKGTDTVFSYATHGTEVLSSIAADKPGFEIGTAPKACVYLYVTEDVSSEYPIEEHNWAAGAEAADSVGADIISSSLGYTEFTDSIFNHTYADMNGHTCMSSIAAVMAARKGMIVCSSAGNEGRHPWFYISAPGDADSIITTGATDSTGTITQFSSHGPTSDGRIKPTVVAQGIHTWVIDPAPSHHTTYPGSGTSFSNPILAGLVACLWQAHQDKNNMQIINAIIQSASLYLTPNDSFGYGIPDFVLADSILGGSSSFINNRKPLIFPNPFATTFDILFFENSPEHVTVDAFDIIGRKVNSFPETFCCGLNNLPVEFLQHAANGVYFLRVKSDDHTDVLQVVKAQE
ncbi:MAG TPA: S8 family serine peptidase [Chitinophagales bacterium]|nr:S8 family serine peptidase [Chitinophagales bacterium]